MSAELPPPLAAFIEHVRRAVEISGRDFIQRHDGGHQFQINCPAHDDSRPSLSVGWGNGKAVIHCQAGCDADDVLAAVGMTWADLSERARIVTTYDYRDEDENLVYQVVRMQPKDFRQRRPDPDVPGEWKWNMRGVTPVLYNLGATLEALASGEDVYIVEGEKDVDALRLGVGAIATTNHGGAGKWRDSHSEPFRGTTSRIVIVADRDAAGEKHALAVRDSLERVAGVAAEIVQSADGKDAAEHIRSHGLEDFVPVSASDLSSWRSGNSTRGTRGQTFTEIDDGPLAEFVAATLRSEFARVPGLGWLRDDGQVWREVTDDIQVDATRLVLKNLVLGEVEDSPVSGARARDLSRLLSAGKIRAVAGLARGMLEVNANAFDTASDFLNTPSGVVDLRTSEIALPDPSRRFTKITAADFDPAARSDDWAQALEALPTKTRAWLQVRLGQAITGHTPPDDVLVVLKGGGENGKSTLFDAIRAALGTYAGLIPDRVLLANPGDHPTELTMLRGLRLAVLEELPEGARFSIKRLKDIVGTSTMTARKIAKDNITWDSTHSIFVTTNYDPKVSETDHGTWRRLSMVRFPYTFRPPGKPLRTKQDRRGDPRLRERLRRDGDAAVLAWLVEGARLWYAADRAFPPTPESVRRDTLSWRKQTDLVLAFASESLHFDPDAVVLAADLFEQFGRWLDQHGHAAWGSQTFASRFGDHSYLRDHNVTKGRKRIESLAPLRLSRPRKGGPRISGTDREPAGNLHVWFGLAWKDAQDSDGTGRTG